MAVELQALALFLSILLTISLMVFHSPISYTEPQVFCEVSTDKTFYLTGETAKINGYIQVDSIYNDVEIILYLFNWERGTSKLLINKSVTLLPKKLLHLKNIWDKTELKWVCEESGEYGIKI